jgi:hypothetical protein
MQLAKVYEPRNGLLPVLRDVYIIAISAGDLTLAGFEQIEYREYTQTWFCRLVREGLRPSGKPDDRIGDNCD